MEKETSERIAPTHEHTDLDAAFKEVYARYGSDLQRFFRDANEDAARRSLEIQKCAKRDVEIQEP